jgi:hypothetical protein
MNADVSSFDHTPNLRQVSDHMIHALYCNNVWAHVPCFPLWVPAVRHQKCREQGDVHFAMRTTMTSRRVLMRHKTIP